MLKICFHSTVDAFYGLLKKKRKEAKFYCGMFVAVASVFKIYAFFLFPSFATNKKK